MNFSQSSVILFAVSLITACTVPSVPPAEYIAFVENPENGLLQSQEAGLLKFQLLHKTPEYIALKESRGKIPEENEFRSRLNELSKMQYFTLRITSLTGETVLETIEEKIDERMNAQSYFDGQMQFDLSMVAGKDTLPCEFYHFEHNHGLAPFNNALLAFNLTENSRISDLQLILNGRSLRIPDVELKIEKKSIKKLPKLIL